jgi:hypothetical protein
MAALAAALVSAVTTLSTAAMADGRFHGRWTHPGYVGVGFYGPYGYGPAYGAYGYYQQPDFDMRDFARYHDRSLYLDSCFVNRGSWTPDGLAVTTINTCYH